MVQLTSGARSYLKNRIPEEDTSVCFRLVPVKDSFALRLTVPEERDVKVAHEGSVVVAADPSVASRLEGWVLDVDVRDGGQKALILLPAPPA